MRIRIIALVVFLFVILWAELGSAALNQNFVLFNNASSLGPRAPQIVAQAYALWVCDVTITGGPTNVKVRVEGNAGASIFDPTGMAEVTLVGPQIAAGIATIEIANHRVKKIRGNLITLTGGTSPTVSLNCVGGD